MALEIDGQVECLLEVWTEARLADATVGVRIPNEDLPAKIAVSTDVDLDLADLLKPPRVAEGFAEVAGLFRVRNVRGRAKVGSKLEDEKDQPSEDEHVLSGHAQGMKKGVWTDVETPWG